MNRNQFVAIAFGVALICCIGSISQADVSGYAFLSVRNLGFYLDAGGGVPGAPLTSGADVTVVAASTSSAVSADVLSVAGGPIANNNFALNATGFDAPQAAEGAAPPENTFTNTLAATPLGRADTWGAGAGLAGLPDPFGAAVDLTAEVDLRTTPTSTDFGRADSSSTSNASFSIIPNNAISVVGVLTAWRQLLADLTPTPPGVAVSADTSFNVTISELGVGVIFDWSPDGAVGGIVGGTEYADPFSLNSAISTFPGTTNNPGLAGPATFSAGVRLLPGRHYSFAIEFQTSASATSIGVPEASCGMLAASAAGAMVVRRRRTAGAVLGRRG